MVKYKSIKRGTGSLRAPLRQALGAPLRQALGVSLSRNAQLLQRPFTPKAITAMGIKRGFDFTQITQKQPSFNLLKIPFIDVNHPDIHTTTTIDSIPRDKIDIGSMMLRRTSVITKVVIGKLIAAFLSVLIVNSFRYNINEIKTNTHTVVNETTEAIYDYMIKNASERVQEGDTTIIASLYKTLGEYISTDMRKKMLENLVIDGVSYGWLAEYDAIIDLWLNKIIEIKGGKLPSDKYIFDLVNIIQNKVLPVSNQIWKLTNTDSVPDSYWYTSEGMMQTAIGLRQMLAEDTLISKIVIGILSATEVVIDTRSIEHIFSDINTMLKVLIIKIKSDIAKGSSGNFKQLHQMVDMPSKTFMQNGDNINNKISELKELEQYLDKTKILKINNLIK